MSDDEQQISSVKWVWFGILAGLVVLVGASTYFLLPRLISKTTAPIEIVKALKGPIKVKPLRPGGKAVDHQDLLVVDILKGGVQSDDQAETLQPNSSNPEPPPIALGEGTATKFTPNIENAETKPQEVLTKNLPSGEKQKKPVGSIPSIIKKVEVLKSVKDKSLNATLSGETPTKNTSSKTKNVLVAIESDIPLYMIQLAAFRNVQKAAEIAKILSQKHKSRLRGIDLETMSVNTGSNGIFYRIVSAPLARKNADKMCDILRRSGQDCFVRKYTATRP